MNKMVVSLADSERRNNFDEMFHNIDYHYFDAIQPDENDARFDQFIAKSLYGRELRRGEVGCTLSHFELIKTFSESARDEQWLLIMEDDALPEPDFFSFIDSFPESDVNMATSPAAILLGHSKTSKKHLFVQALKQPLYLKEFINGIQFGQSSRISVCGTVSYLINKAAARIISCANRPYWKADDWRLFSNLGITVKHPVRPLIYEDISYASATENELVYLHDFWRSPLSSSFEILASHYRYFSELKHFK